MKSKILATLFTAVLAFSTPAQADETVAIKAGFMLLSASGQLGAAVNNIGTNLDLETDLKLGNSTQPTGELTINLGDTLFSFGIIPINFSGTSSLTRNITYNGQNYAAGSVVSSELKADIFDVGYTYYLVNMDDLPSRFQLGIESAVKTISLKTSLTSAGITSSKSITLPIPTLGLRGRVALADFIGLTGRVGYLGYSGNTFTDIDAQIEFSPLPTLGIYAGYRHLNIKLNSNGIFANTTLAGPYAGGFFRF